MGNFLSKLRPPQLGPAPEAGSRPPARPAPPAPAAHRYPVHPSVPTPFLRSPWRPSCWYQDSSVRSAFTPVLTKGVRTPLVPKPGPLKRGLNVQSSDGHLNKRFHPYTRGIPMSGRSHNAIPSDYSSTGGVSQLRKRRGSGASSFSIPTSCYMKTIERPAKKMREEELPPNSGSSAPLGSDTQSQGEQATTTSGKANSRDSPPSSTRPRKRKFQLVPSRRGIPLILPETPMLGYPITVEDYEQVQTDWVKTIFEDKTGWSPFPSGKEQDQKHEKDLTSLAVTHDQDLQDQSPEEPERKRTCLDNDIEDNDIEDIDIGRN